MTRAELKAQARAQLGGGIFKNEWLTALAVCFIAMAICSAAGGLPARRRHADFNQAP